MDFYNSTPEERARFYAQAAERVNQTDGYAKGSHVRITHIALGSAEGELEVCPEVLNPLGIVHGDVGDGGLELCVAHERDVALGHGLLHLGGDDGTLGHGVVDVGGDAEQEHRADGGHADAAAGADQIQ